METNLLFLDLETEGLDPAYDRIIEIAILPVDANLEPLDAGWSQVILHQGFDSSRLNKTVSDMHTKNGLLKEIANGEGISLFDAIKEAVTYCNKYGTRGQLPMAGSSIHFDRKFLSKYAPLLDSWFHYRCADVSSIKEYWKRWYPEHGEPPKQNAHRALADCYASVAEALWYKSRLQYVNPEGV